MSRIVSRGRELLAHRARDSELLRCAPRCYASKGSSDAWWYMRRARLKEARAEAARAEAARAREEELAEADSTRGDREPAWVTQTTYTRRRPSPSVFDESDVTALLTREMRGFMERVSAQPPDPWFHRQSEKLVLAALMVHAEDDDGVRRPQFVFGLNAEVSLPAGRDLGWVRVRARVRVRVSIGVRARARARARVRVRVRVS